MVAILELAHYWNNCVIYRIQLSDDVYISNWGASHISFVWVGDSKEQLWVIGGQKYAMS